MGAEQLPVPVKIVGDEIPPPAKAPTVGQHADEVLREVLSYDDATIERLRTGGAFGKTDG